MVERHGKGPSVSPGRAFTQGHGGGARLTALSHLTHVPTLTGYRKRAWLPVTTEVEALLDPSSVVFWWLEGTSSSRTAPGPPDDVTAHTFLCQDSGGGQTLNCIRSRSKNEGRAERGGVSNGGRHRITKTS